jgi:hypothetical protein
LDTAGVESVQRGRFPTSKRHPRITGRLTC